jgi:hypothetical protein
VDASALPGRGLRCTLVVDAVGREASRVPGHGLGEVDLARRARGAGWCIVTITSRRRLVRQISATYETRLGRPVAQFYSDRKTVGPIVVACVDSLPNLTAALEGQGLRCGLLLVDEAHSASSDARQEAIAELDPHYRIGVTATPYRSGGKAMPGWDEVAYSYRIGDALRDGVLVPPVAVPWTGEDEVSVDVAIAAMVMQVAPPGPGIVSARSIADAEWYAAEVLGPNGVAAEAIHSQLKPSEQEARIQRLRDGELRCLVHPSLLTEGVDFPWLTWLGLRVRRSSVKLVQEVGRGLRLHGDKAECIVLDPLRQLGVSGRAGKSVDHDAILGDLEDAAMAATDRGDAEPPETETAAELVKRISEMSRWCEEAASVVYGVGWAREARRTGVWRDRPISDALAKQLEQRRGKGQIRWLPKPCRARVKELLLNSSELTQGAASDLLAVLSAGAAQGGRHMRANHAAPAHIRFGWKWPASVALPPLPAEER